MATTEQFTIEDLLALDDDGCRHELIRGELLSMPPTSDEHGSLMLHLSALLWTYQRSHPEIKCFAGDTGFLLGREPDTLVGPDLAAVRVERLPADFPRRTYVDLAPDFVIEILSPSERPAQLNRKVQQYLDAGVRLIWLVDPARRTITAHSPDQPPSVVEVEAEIDGGDVLPGFRLALADLFG